MQVYIDSAPENMVHELTLNAEGVLEERWNGWVRPLATAEALGEFHHAWRANDPNGIWGYVTEVGDTLVCTRSDADDYVDEFPEVGTTRTAERFTTSQVGSGCSPKTMTGDMTGQSRSAS